MIRLPQAIAAVIVSWLFNPAGPGPNAGVDPTEFGLGLGVVSGLFLGAGTGVFHVTVLALRDAWLARAGVTARSKRPDDDAF